MRMLFLCLLKIFPHTVVASFLQLFETIAGRKSQYTQLTPRQTVCVSGGKRSSISV